MNTNPLIKRVYYYFRVTFNLKAYKTIILAHVVELPKDFPIIVLPKDSPIMSSSHDRVLNISKKQSTVKRDPEFKSK